MPVRLRNHAPAWWTIEMLDGTHLAGFTTEAARALYLSWWPGWEVVG